jgi:arylsulfatase A-like enzyme
MKKQRSKKKTYNTLTVSLHKAYSKIAPRAYSFFIFIALACTLLAKLVHSIKYDLIQQYPSWIFSDISVLLAAEIIIALICYRWPKNWVIRTSTIFAGLICTWSFMNAGWLIRTGTQILPTELLPLIREPINIIFMVAVNMIKMPKASAILLVPGIILIIFFIFVLTKPLPPKYNSRQFLSKVLISLIIIFITATGHATVVVTGSTQIASAGLCYNSQSKAILTLFWSEFKHLNRADFDNATRVIPCIDNIDIVCDSNQPGYNLVIVILEGVQYMNTSLAEQHFSGPTIDRSKENVRDRTPFLKSLAEQGINFTNARSTVAHTTKAIFALMSGKTPSASQDIAETIPVENSYVSIPSILKKQFNYKTAFFQSAKGNFESRPGLVHNLGFDKFWSREDLNDPNSFIGYLGCDEFALLEPITEWIKSDDKPFMLTIMCSVTHDPYEVPQWYCEAAEELTDKYAQTITYTDRFIAALDVELTKLGLSDNTIFCVVGDHGEAFGKHNLMGHERIAFDEVLRIPMCIRAPFLAQTGTVITAPVSSVDLAPTLLTMLGFDCTTLGFDGANALAEIDPERRVYFSGWMSQGPAGFIQAGKKYIHDPTENRLTVYMIDNDIDETINIELSEAKTQEITKEIIDWRKSTIFKIKQDETGKQVLFNNWNSKWTNRISSVKRLHQ